MSDRTIKYMDLDEVKEDPRNPKAHSEDLIDESITMHGLIEPVQLDERTFWRVGWRGPTRKSKMGHQTYRPSGGRGLT